MQMEKLASAAVYCTMKGIPDTRKIVAVYRPDTCKEEMIQHFLEMLRKVLFEDQLGIFQLGD